MRGKRNQETWQRNHENRFILFLLLTGLKSRTTSGDFEYQAASWDKPRRVVAKVEWHPGDCSRGTVLS